MSNIDDSGTEDGTFNPLDLKDANYSKFLEQDAINVKFPNVILANEFKPLYLANGDNLENSDIQLSTLEFDDSLKTNEYYLMQLQHTLRKMYHDFTESFFKYIGLENIETISRDMSEFNRTKGYLLFEEFLENEPHMARLIKSYYSLDDNLTQLIKDQNSLTDSSSRSPRNFLSEYQNIAPERAREIIGLASEQTQTIEEPLKDLTDKEELKEYFKSFLISRIFLREYYKTYVYKRLRDLKTTYEKYEFNGIDSPVITIGQNNSEVMPSLSAQDFLTTKNQITNQRSTEVLSSSEFLMYNRHQINLSFYNFHKLFTIYNNKSEYLPAGKHISDFENNFLKLYFLGDKVVPEEGTNLFKKEVGKQSGQGKKTILNIGIPNGMVTQLNYARIRDFIKRTTGTGFTAADLSPNYISTIIIDVYKNDQLRPNRIYKPLRFYFDMDTFCFPEGKYDSGDVHSNYTNPFEGGSTTSLAAFSSTLRSTSKYLENNLSSTTNREEIIAHFPVYKAVNTAPQIHRKPAVQAGTTSFKPINIHLVNQPGVEDTIDDLYSQNNSLEGLNKIDMSPYANSNLDIIKKIIGNHIEDYALKLYTRTMIGVDVSEENFHLKEAKIMNVDNPLASLNRAASMSGYEKESLEKIINLFYDSESEEIDKGVDKISTQKLVEKEIRKSMYYANQNYAQMCLRPKSYDRIFSILIDDDMFTYDQSASSNSDVVDQRFDPDTGSVTDINEASMSKYEVTIRLADHNFHYDYSSKSDLPADNSYPKINIENFDLSHIFPFENPGEELGTEYIPSIGKTRIINFNDSVNEVVNYYENKGGYSFTLTTAISNIASYEGDATIATRFQDTNLGNDAFAFFKIADFMKVHKDFINDVYDNLKLARVTLTEYLLSKVGEDELETNMFANYFTNESEEYDSGTTHDHLGNAIYNAYLGSGLRYTYMPSSADIMIHSDAGRNDFVVYYVLGVTRTMCLEGHGESNVALAQAISNSSGLGNASLYFFLHNSDGRIRSLGQTLTDNYLTNASNANPESDPFYILLEEHISGFTPLPSLKDYFSIKEELYPQKIGDGILTFEKLLESMMRYRDLSATATTVTLYNELSNLPSEYFTYPYGTYIYKPEFYQKSGELTQKLMTDIENAALLFTQYIKDYNLPLELNSFRNRVLQELSNTTVGIMCAGERTITFDLLVRIVTRKGINFIDIAAK